MRVLVIIASFNGEKYIKKQIETILFQEDVDLDIIVSDDASKDKTIEIIETFFSMKNVTLIKNSFSSGSAANNFFNTLKNLSDKYITQYDFISFADQDDIWLPYKLKAAINMLQKEKSNLYMSNMTLWDEKTNSKSTVKKSYPQKKYDFLFEGGSAGCTYVFTNKLGIELKKKLINVDYSNWKFFSHDWFVYFFARINNYGVSIDSNSYILYRIHENNVHGQLNKNSIFALKERLKVIKQGWYLEHIKGYIKLLPNNSKEKRIYELYYNNYLTRMYVLFWFNFSLMRSRKKFIQFFIISLIPIKINK